MPRRYAILDDNQRFLETRLDQLRSVLPDLLRERACAAAVIGSVAAGTARDWSDLDVVVVLRAGLPTRADYRWWDDCVAARLPEANRGRFPVQPLFIARSAVLTTEPHLRAALRTAIVLWDPEEALDDQRTSAA